MVRVYTMGDRIKSLRQQNKMSQEDLGQRLGFNRAAVNKYEKGTVVNIPLVSLLKMCSIFGVSLNYLVLGKTSYDSQTFENEIQCALGDTGYKCYKMLQMISDEGLSHAVPYLEQLSKIYHR